MVIESDLAVAGVAVAVSFGIARQLMKIKS